MAAGKQRKPKFRPQLRDRLWVAGENREMLPAILVDVNLLLVRYVLDSAAVGESLNLYSDRQRVVRWQLEPLGRRKVAPRVDVAFEFDHWKPCSCFLKFIEEDEGPGLWTVAMRSESQTWWALIRREGGELELLLDACRDLCRRAGHTMPSVQVDPPSVNLCPRADLDALPGGTKARAAVDEFLEKFSQAS